jgi:hypothetical protein
MRGTVMPVFVRPARVVVIEDGGGGGGVLVALLVAAALAGPVVAKVLGWIATPVTVALWTAVALAVAGFSVLPWWVKRNAPRSTGSFVTGVHRPLEARRAAELAAPPAYGIEAAKGIPGVALAPERPLTREDYLSYPDIRKGS